MKRMSLQKLIAFDEADLAVISAHLQDAALSAKDMVYLPQERRFALVAERYAREENTGKTEKRPVGLHFEQVSHVRTHKVTPGSNEQLQLLALHFAETEAPSGRLHLVFAGGSEICLDVECLEAAMSDLGRGTVCACPEHVA